MQEKLKVGTNDVFKAGSALAGGVARQGETCGALIGAIMTIGLLVGRAKLEDLDQYRKAMELGIRVYNLFKKEIGHTICWEIHKIRYGKIYRLFIPEESEAFQKIGGHSRKGCPEVCGIGARIAADVILDIRKNPKKVLKF